MTTFLLIVLNNPRWFIPDVSTGDPEERWIDLKKKFHPYMVVNGTTYNWINPKTYYCRLFYAIQLDD